MQKIASFHERLVTRRNRLNLTQPALAERSGVSARSISDYELGKAIPTLRQVEKLAKSLDVSAAWLVGGAAEETEAEPALPHKEDGIPYRITSIDLTTMSDELLETIFKSLMKEASEAQQPERSKLLQSLESINQEQRRRSDAKVEAARAAHLKERAEQAGKKRRPGIDP